MSKTWKRGEGRRERWRRREKWSEVEAECEARKSRTENPRKISAEWAMERIADRVEYVVDELSEQGWIAAADSEYYAALIRDEVAEGVGTYDPSLLDGTGRRCAPSHYCLQMVDRIAANIRRNIGRFRKTFTELPISELPPEQAEKYGFISSDSLSDNSRSVRDVEFRMDVNTLIGLLRPLEAETLARRLEGYTEEEIARKNGLSRFQVMRLLKRIRGVARKCGFVPFSEMRRGRVSEGAGK